MLVLENVISAEGIKPVKMWSLSPSVSELRSFIGTCQYLSKFILNYAKVMETLRTVTVITAIRGTFTINLRERQLEKLS